MTWKMNAPICVWGRRCHTVMWDSKEKEPSGVMWVEINGRPSLGTTVIPDHIFPFTQTARLRFQGELNQTGLSPPGLFFPSIHNYQLLAECLLPKMHHYRHTVPDHRAHLLLLGKWQLLSNPASSTPHPLTTKPDAQCQNVKGKKEKLF